MKKIILLYLLILLTHAACLSQNNKIDSLKIAVQNAKQDTTRLRIYLALGDVCEKQDKPLYAEAAFKIVDKLFSNNIDRKQRDSLLEKEGEAYNLIANYYSSSSRIDWNKMIIYCEKRLNGIEKTNNQRRVAETLSLVADLYLYSNDTTKFLNDKQKSLALFRESKDSVNIVGSYLDLCQFYLTIGNFSKAFESVQSSIQISKQLGYKEGIAQGLQKLADMYRDYGENAQALENYKNALSILRGTKDTNILFNVTAALGGFYYTQHNVEKALEYYNKLLDLCRTNTNINHLRVGDVYMWMGMVYRDNNDYRNSLLNFQKSLSAFDSAKYKVNVKNVLDELGSVYNKQAAFDKAIECHKKAIKLADTLGWEPEKSHSQYLLALDYYAQKDYKAASEYNNQALTGLKKQVDVKPISEAELLASRIDSAMGNGNGAYTHYKDYIALSNKLKGDEIRTEAQKENFQNELERQKAEQYKRDAEAKRIKTQQYFIIAALSLVVLAVVVIAAMQYRNNKQKQKANTLLQKQKEEIELQKEKAESTLSNLKSTQAQLIQSEKMASLGELTAGIAHEIQNPLNFVNNFSDINKELVDELEQEADKGNIDEVKTIAKDIRENEEKINHHGKRADAIVKGMLQHSRQTKGIKEPTDINALCDEYLRLSYHGLRAKDKDFNATINTNFDESIGTINIIPQDISRVLLNLFNNAFYAVNEKKKQLNGAFAPAVSVCTKKLNGKVEIQVKDNGNGIPQSIINKIFQPFFTTKPTGEGTGLGLSLSYDIIKAHGGEIKVGSKECEGSSFSIYLPLK